MKMAVVVVVVVKMMIQNIRVRDRQGGCATAAEPLEGSDDDHRRHRAVMMIIVDISIYIHGETVKR